MNFVIPAEMKAVVWRTPSAAGVKGQLVDVTMPVPTDLGPHDLLVEVKAASVNPVDMKVAGGTEVGAPDRILGWDAAGIVRLVGTEVTLFQVGDEVYYAGAVNRPGSDAQFELVNEEIVGHKPSSLSFAEAAAIPLTSLTAWECLFDKLDLTSETSGTLLVLGGAGGVGSMIIQLAKKLTNLRVIVTASRPESAAWAKKLGADATVDYTAPDFADQILKLAPDGVDYAFTSQSKGAIELFKKVMRPFGEIVAIDDEPDLDTYALKDKSLSWHWELMFTRALYGYHQMEQHRALEKIGKLIDSGTIQGTLTKTFTPFDAAQFTVANAELNAGHTTGKLVVANP